MNTAKLNWLRDNRGQIKVQLVNGSWQMIITWYNDDRKLELITHMDDSNWFQKVTFMNMAMIE